MLLLKVAYKENILKGFLLNYAIKKEAYLLPNNNKSIELLGRKLEKI